MRKDLKIKKVIDLIGAALAIVGFAGIAGATEGEGNPIIAIVVFAIGFGICLWGHER